MQVGGRLAGGGRCGLGQWLPGGPTAADGRAAFAGDRADRSQTAADRRRCGCRGGRGGACLRAQGGDRLRAGKREDLPKLAATQTGAALLRQAGWLYRTVRLHRPGKPERRAQPPPFADPPAGKTRLDPAQPGRRRDRPPAGPAGSHQVSTGDRRFEDDELSSGRVWDPGTDPAYRRAAGDPPRGWRFAVCVCQRVVGVRRGLSPPHRVPDHRCRRDADRRHQRAGQPGGEAAAESRFPVPPPGGGPAPGGGPPASGKMRLADSVGQCDHRRSPTTGSAVSRLRLLPGGRRQRSALRPPGGDRGDAHAVDRAGT